jgi:hypothetical protein
MVFVAYGNGCSLSRAREAAAIERTVARLNIEHAA